MRRLLIGLVLVDLPVMLGALLAGFVYGFANSFHAVMDFRSAHPWTYIPSACVVVYCIVRWRRGRAAAVEKPRPDMV